jgi:quercetin dioxygenase-like cupin family protein
MLSDLLRNHKGTLLASLFALLLAIGWGTREYSHAQEKAKFIASKTVHLAEVKRQDIVYEGRPRGDVGIFFDGDTPGTTKFVTGIARLKPGEEPHPIHTHPEEEILIVTGGKGEISCDGKVTRVGPGSVMYTGPNAPHGIKNTGDDVMTFYFVKWTGVDRRK